ncbi:glutaredoxin domain-containing protein, partial [Bacillus sp. D-CC]
MVTLYSSPSCTSCRKAKLWLEENHIPYTERNIFSDPLTIEEIKEILRMTESGTDEIIFTRHNRLTHFYPDHYLGQQTHFNT